MGALLRIAASLFYVLNRPDTTILRTVPVLSNNYFAGASLYDLKLTTGADCSDLLARIDGLTAAAWPEFMLHDPVAVTHFHCLFDDYPEYQFVLEEPGSGKIAALGNCGPLIWHQPLKKLPDRGWDSPCSKWPV